MEGKILLYIFAPILIVGAVVGLLYGSLVLYKFFAPKYKEVERNVWQETPSRILGANQDIANKYYQYQNTNDTVEKSAICAYLRQMYSDISPDKIKDYELRQFFAKCKYGG